MKTNNQQKKPEYALSERLYRHLLTAYPAEFRSEYGRLMVQLFRDRLRDERRLGGSLRLIRFWTHTLFDLVLTAAAEHLKREETEMISKSQYIVRTFLKYVMRLACFLVVVSILWIIGGNAMASHKEEASNQAWSQTLGNSMESLISSYPKLEQNESANKLEEMSTRLGITQHSVNIAELMRGSLNYDYYLSKQLESSNDEISAPPDHVKRYLTNHANDLDSLYSFINQNEAPQWPQDLSDVFKAPVPTLMFHRLLHNVIALDVLEKTRLGENKQSLEAFKAAWKINQSLSERPDLISQLIAMALSNTHAGLLRKMADVPEEWQDRVIEHNYQKSLLKAFLLEAYTLSKWEVGKGLPFRHNFDAMYWPILSSPLGRPYIRIRVVNHLERMRETIAGFQTQSQHSFNPLCSIKAYHSSFGLSWNSRSGFMLRHWEAAIRTDLNLEFTKRILHAKESQEPGDKTASQVNTLRESSLCFDGVWSYDRDADGRLSIGLNDVPSLAQFDGNLPLRYTLTDIHRSQQK